MKKFNLDAIEKEFFDGGSPWRKLLAISLDLVDARHSGILYGTNETKIKFLPTSMWDRGIMDKFDGRGVGGCILRFFGAFIVTIRNLSPVLFYKTAPGGELVENDGVISYVLRKSADYYKKGTSVIICPNTGQLVCETQDGNEYDYISFFNYDGMRFVRPENGIKVDTRIIKHFKSSNSIYIILPDYGILVLNTADVGLLEVRDDKFVREEELRERLDLLIKLVEIASLAYLGQLKGKKGAELLWRKEVHLRRAYLDLAENERKYRDLYENAPIAYFSMDRDGKILRCNQKACFLSEYEKHQLYGKNVQDLFGDKEQVEQNFYLIWQTLEKGGGVKDMEIDMFQRDKNRIWVSLSADAIKGENDEIVEIRAIAMDISRRKTLEKQLIHAQKMEAIGTLARGIAHDFNNVLSPISGYAQMLLMDTVKNGLDKEHLNIILDCARHAKDLVNQILTFSRQKEHKKVLVKTGNAVIESLGLIRSFLSSTIKVTTNIDEDCGYIMADPIQINQLIMNLVTNAYHAMEKTGGLLEICLTRIQIHQSTQGKEGIKPGVYACLSVADTGYGIDKDIINNIFEPYFSTKEEGKGSGIGLSVAHGIVESHGGYIRVESCKGEGTKFMVYFPVCQHRGDAKKDSLPDLTVESGAERVLLVDDDEKVAAMYTRLLERLGYGVTCFTDSLTALSAYTVSPEKFDVVITDLTMPDLNGFDLAKKMYEINPDLPIILCTGLGDSIDKHQDDACCIKGFLSKPVEIKVLSSTIRGVLDQASA
ncbi:MAG: response regulator [Desulfobacteraceae bacterium]|nr:response regulator [Desulfobacteraceae bacterium]